MECQEEPLNARAKTWHPHSFIRTLPRPKTSSASPQTQRRHRLSVATDDYIGHDKEKAEYQSIVKVYRMPERSVASGWTGPRECFEWSPQVGGPRSTIELDP